MGLLGFIESLSYSVEKGGKKAREMVGKKSSSSSLVALEEEKKAKRRPMARVS